MSSKSKQKYNPADMKFMHDTMYVLSGKWKMLIILSICNGNKRFMEIYKAIPQITTRMLSKELKELEVNKLISRTVYPDIPVMVEYNITDYSTALEPVIAGMIKWGKQHRQALFKEIQSVNDDK